MGTFYVQGRLSHQRQRRLQRNLRFLVDTGAFFSVVPREILSGLTVLPMREETVQYADGRKARWKLGEVRLEVDGRWLAEVLELPGVLAYGESQEAAVSKVQALALRVIAERLEHGEAGPDLLSISFKAA